MRHSRDLRMRQSSGRRTAIQRGIAALTKFGAAANFYLPGIGAINGITAGNWLDSAGTAPATVDGQVWRIDNARGGANLTQSTVTNRPILRRGLINLLPYSHDCGNAAWVGTYTRTLDIGVGPNNTNAWRITATASPSVFTRPAIVVPTVVVTMAVIFKSGTAPGNNFLIRNSTTSTNLVSTTTSVNLGNGWFLAALSASSGFSIGDQLSLYFGTTGQVPDGQYWWVQAGAFYAGVVTAQQILDAGGISTTASSPSSSQSGPFLWQLDGNDFFSTSLPVSDDCWICAGVSFNGTASGLEGVISTGAGTAVSRGMSLARYTTSNRLSLITANGTTLTFSNYDHPTPINNGTKIVVEGCITPTSQFCGINGVMSPPVARSGSIQPQSQATTYVGAWGSGFYLNGGLYPIIVVNAATSVSDRDALRRLVAILSNTPI